MKGLRIRKYLCFVIVFVILLTNSFVYADEKEDYTSERQEQGTILEDIETVKNIEGSKNLKEREENSVIDEQLKSFERKNTLEKYILYNDKGEKIKGYEHLYEAVEATDEAMGYTIVITEDDDIEDTISITDNKKIVLKSADGKKCKITNSTGKHFYISDSGRLTLENIILSGEKKSGGIYAYGGSRVNLINSTIKECISDFRGGGIYIYNSILNSTNTTIEKCTAEDGGGGICAYGGESRVDLINSTIKECISDFRGGGIYVYDGTMNLTNTIIEECRSEEGGGVNAYGGTNTANLINCTIEKCTAEYGGGGVNSYGKIINLTNSIIEKCTAKYGGGICDNGESIVNLKNSTIKMCTAEDGGGIFMQDHDYGDPLEEYSYRSINTDATVIFEENIAKEGDSIRLFNPPSNAGDLENIKFKRTSLTGTNIMESGNVDFDHPLNNFDINYLNKPIPVFEVKYDSNGGKGDHRDIYEQNIDYYIKSIADVNISRKGYNFIGWNTESNGSGTNYFPEDKIKLEESITLYAQWGKYNGIVKPTIKEITLVGGTSTLTKNVENQLMDFVQYRLSGRDRYGTSVVVAKEYNKSNVVLLASGEKFTDELTATVLADKLDAPIMLTRKDAIPAEVKAEINRLEAKKVILVGGSNSVSEKVDQELSGYTVERIGGSDRYDTAILVGNQVRGLTGSKTEAILVDGTNFPDAIAMTSMAVEGNMPILLTKPSQLPASTAKAMQEWNLNKVTIGGGVNSVTNTVANEVKKFAEVSRIAGSDRYETSVLVAEQVYENPTHVVMASGEVFPDAIVGAPYAAKNGYPIVLSKKDNVPMVVLDYLFGNR